MRPIRLAVIFDQQIYVGGGYQQALNAALLTRGLPTNLVTVIFFTTVAENVQTLNQYGIETRFIKQPFLSKLWFSASRFMRYSSFFWSVRQHERRTYFEKKLIDLNIDLVYFLSPSGLANSLTELNYITTVWDLCHRDYPEFPEVRRGKEFEAREQNYRTTLPRAVAVFVDSELGKLNAVHRYGLDADRIHVMPFQASTSARESAEANAFVGRKISKNYGLDVPYIFYPAQFWAHKNHVYLIEGLIELERRYQIKIGAIFAGGNQGNRAYIENYVRQHGLELRVRFTGFVSNDEIIALYRQSLALVMPTYFGPTNLPPLEAFQLGVPVLYPDNKGLREQVHDAALFIDLKNPGSMAEQISRLISDNKLRDSLIQKGFERLEALDSVDRISILLSVIEDFRWKRLCWA